MAILKCKMCGGDIEVLDQSYGECNSCGSKTTLPKIDDERKANLFNRANHFRRQNDFDKAVLAYENILNEDNSDAEAHWGLVLSKYGIEYVEDPYNHKRVPTCHRVQNESILSDPDYLQAIENAPDGYTRSLYEEEAKLISDIQKGILSISNNEKPYDVFICYKESSESGIRTKDSTMAQDIYYQLTNEGFKVFFSRIVLEDKLGVAYEPYIFAALNSAKVMLVIGTKTEYINATWVKNEWSRYLKLMKTDRSKLLIPCYAEMDAYDLPEELSMFQSQDMTKIGFVQDLIRGVKKVLISEIQKKTETQPTANTGYSNINALLKRAFMYLEDKEWNNADEYAEKVLDLDPESANAYLAKLMAELNVSAQDDLRNQAHPFDGMNNYQKAVRFADPSFAARLKAYNSEVLERNENKRKEGIYQKALSNMDKDSGKDQLAAADLFRSICGYKDAEELILICENEAERLRLQEEQERLEKERLAEQKSDILKGKLVKYNGTDLVVQVPRSVISIGESAFFNCTSLTEIKLPDSVTSIGESAFSYCTSLTEITIPDGVTSIEESTFFNCTSLTEITIPDSVTSIGESAFSKCTSLTEITIPDGVTSIGNFAFSKCTSLTEIKLPDSVTSIGDFVFSKCTSLTKITIPDSVTSIGNSAFSKCTSLTEIKLPDSMTSIGIYAFSKCTSLTEITIPDSVRYIGSSAFSQTRFESESKNSAWVKKSNSGCYIATSVYGSYDCPQVLKLRLFRDQVLSATWYGRLFIKVYYSISPKLVKLLGNTKWFNLFWKKILDYLLVKLDRLQ